MKTKKMIKVSMILMVVLLSFSSCNKDVDATEPAIEPAPDCDCDEIIEYTTFNLLNVGYLMMVQTSERSDSNRLIVTFLFEITQIKIKEEKEDISLMRISLKSTF